MKVDHYLKKYEEGHLSPEQMADYCMGIITRDNVDSILSVLPKEVYSIVHDFAVRYNGQPLLQIGDMPVLTESQIAAIVDWVHNHPGST